MHGPEGVIYKGSFALCRSGLLAMFHHMKINRAIGLGIGILVLQWLMSEVFAGFEETLMATFDTTQAALGAVERGVSTSTSTLIPTPGVQ